MKKQTSGDWLRGPSQPILRTRIKIQSKKEAKGIMEYWNDDLLISSYKLRLKVNLFRARPECIAKML